ncbi:CubicO group peptidase, beta-lactamase class C family [Hymenobacter daecheongensis DSM 21074]|uniref:CubicO group peptidase, beta-lactamase class C family n=1 Tax=Hymenobacter daecheongensis DSM 21074 TaxID=1121955 RepID=A0A1M6MCP2_9BACT|nr:serine hydrolase domain-containing protein [Hymenobacter daecheongensis]SHJ81139.1 CubicO group peptidase, beta-lactamase class C family [Hymenobacter daecheongensis DSM 21074]
MFPILLLAGFTAFTLLATPARSQPAPPTPPDTAALTTALRQHWQQSDFPGFAVAVVRPEGIVYEHGFGYANKARQTAYTPATVQCVGSVSKTLIGVALLQAAAEGKLRLDQPVNELLPFRVVNPYFPDQPITLRQLATMTAGLTDKQGFYGRRAYAKGRSSALSNEEYLRRTLSPGGRWYSRRRFVNHAPGTYYAYSNESAALAALALEKATGQPYDAYTRQRILLPLGMSDSGWRFADTDSARHATLYSPRGRAVPPYYTITYPDGGLLTSTHSLALYLRSVLNPASPGAPLPAAAVDSLLRPQFAAARLPAHLDPAEPNQGLFWAHRRNGTVGHTGGDTGLTTFLFFDPVTRTGKIFVTNTEIHDSPRSLARFKAIWQLLDQVP